MKWFLTGDSLGLASRLADVGETIDGGPAYYRDLMMTEEPNDYALSRHLLKFRGLDVVVLDQLFELPGYAKKSTLPWGGSVRGRCVVGVDASDPAGFARFQRGWRGCICGLAHIGVYVTPDRETANKASVARRVVYWEGDVAPLIAAVTDQCQYKPIAGVGRIYTTTGQHTSI